MTSAHSVARALSFVAVSALTFMPVPAPVSASDYRTAMASVSGEMNARSLTLGISKSLVIDLPRDVKDVLVADPKIANAVVRSARRAYIIGATVGQTNIVFFDSDGQQIAAYDVVVTRDLNGLRSLLHQVLPQSDIHVEGLGPDGVVLSGTAANQAEAQQAVELAGRLVGGGATAATDKVVNSIVVRGRDQVTIKVTVAEVQRDIVKQLGIDLDATVGYGPVSMRFSNTNAFAGGAGPSNGLSSVIGAAGSLRSLSATLRALESANVVRTLAEPTLTAISGESATFLAGGQIPIPTATTGSGGAVQVGTDFKNIGVSLSFTPVVLTEGRISLRVMTEVSEPSSQTTLIGTAAIPTLTTRRTETTLEVPSGGSMAMAGLIQNNTTQFISGFPGMTEVPVLGTLFRSRDFQNHQTELVVIVTPYIVRAVAQKDLSRPDDGFVAASDPQAILLGNINRLYGVPNRDPQHAYSGQFGFITD